MQCNNHLDIPDCEVKTILDYIRQEADNQPHLKEPKSRAITVGSEQYEKDDIVEVQTD